MCRDVCVYIYTIIYISYIYVHTICAEGVGVGFSSGFACFVRGRSSTKVMTVADYLNAEVSETGFGGVTTDAHWWLPPRTGTNF
jgi:hypothetical protein